MVASVTHIQVSDLNFSEFELAGDFQQKDFGTEKSDLNIKM